MKTKPKTKRVKAWAVIRQRATFIGQEKTHLYQFEDKPEQKYGTPQKSLLIFSTEWMAKKWKNKWNNSYVFEVIPCTVTYQIPTKLKGKR